VGAIPYSPQSPLDVLLHKLFDYAGMFPPAERSFDQALRESASFPTTLSRPWMVGSDLVLDTQHAKKLATENLLARGFTTPPVLCVLATEDMPQVKETLEALAAKPSHARLGALEIKVTPDSIASTISAYAALTTSLGALMAIEPDLSGDNWRETLSSAVATIARARAAVALKCRCSGPTGVGPDRLAAAIVEVCDTGIAFKVTGGLHHPIVEPDRYPFPTGFLNVAAALMIRRALGKTVPESFLLELLCNRSIRDIRLEKGLGFGSLFIDHAQLIQAKNQSHFSIGSCSLHEPDADLTRLVPKPA